MILFALAPAFDNGCGFSIESLCRSVDIAFGQPLALPNK
jgi:hypothetical protein